MKKIYHIDCTLRDGGYYNLWNFEERLVQKYLECMEKVYEFSDYLAELYDQ